MQKIQYVQKNQYVQKERYERKERHVQKNRKGHPGYRSHRACQWCPATAASTAGKGLKTAWMPGSAGATVAKCEPRGGMVEREPGWAWPCASQAQDSGTVNRPQQLRPGLRRSRAAAQRGNGGRAAGPRGAPRSLGKHARLSEPRWPSVSHT